MRTVHHSALGRREPPDRSFRTLLFANETHKPSYSHPKIDFSAGLIKSSLGLYPPSDASPINVLLANIGPARPFLENRKGLPTKKYIFYREALKKKKSLVPFFLVSTRKSLQYLFLISSFASCMIPLGYFIINSSLFYNTHSNFIVHIMNTGWNWRENWVCGHFFLTTFPNCFFFAIEKQYRLEKLFPTSRPLNNTSGFTLSNNLICNEIHGRCISIKGKKEIFL